MGLRYRTPIGTLREQRRRAENAKTTHRTDAVQLRVRALESLQTSHKDSHDLAKGRKLLERLRQTLRDERSSNNDAAQDYQSLQDELSRINMRHLAKEGSIPVQDISFEYYPPSTQPFTLVVIKSEDHKKDFPTRINRLESPLSNLDSYLKLVRGHDEGKVRPLTLVNEAQAPELPPKDHSDEAAALVQDTVANSHSPMSAAPIPASLALSLLND